MAFKGIYRKGNWAFVENERGQRDILAQDEYRAQGISPSFADLLDEVDFNVAVLSRRPGERDTTHSF